MAKRQYLDFQRSSRSEQSNQPATNQFAEIYHRAIASPDSPLVASRIRFATGTGVALGLALLGIAAGLGGGSLLLNNSLAYESLRWTGALFLCWLAFDGWNDARRPIETTAISQSRFVHFRRGVITNLLNPKTALFFIAVLPEFIQGPAHSATQETVILISVYVGVATLVHSLNVVLAGGLQTFLAAPQRREMAGNIFAVLLLAIAAWLFISGRR